MQEGKFWTESTQVLPGSLTSRFLEVRGVLFAKLACRRLELRTNEYASWHRWFRDSASLMGCHVVAAIRVRPASKGIYYSSVIS